MRKSIKRTTAIIAILMIVAVLTSTVSPVVFAQQTARADWTAVQSLGTDENLSHRLKDVKIVSGKFSSANDSELTIIRKGKRQVIAKDSIAQVHHLKRKAEKAKYAAIGAGIGAGAAPSSAG